MSSKIEEQRYLRENKKVEEQRSLAISSRNSQVSSSSREKPAEAKVESKLLKRFELLKIVEKQVKDIDPNFSAALPERSQDITEVNLNAAQKNIEAAVNSRRKGNEQVKLLTMGRAKVVWKGKGNKVYYTPVNPSKEREIQEEVVTAKNINTDINNVKKPSLEIHKENIATKIIEKGTEILGLYTVETSSAEGDMENYLEGARKVGTTGEKFTTVVAIDSCRQILGASALLHETGRVQGDIKPDNILRYEGGEAATQLKISDLGKCQELAPNESRLYEGNQRYAPPEMELSQKGEVYSTALLLIRFLETPLLGSKEMLLTVSPASAKKYPGNIKDLWGIEKYLCLHEDCPQRYLGGISRVAGQVFGWAKSKLSQEAQQKAHDAIKAYIAVLCRQIALPKEQKERLRRLLEEMTHSDPAQRPTMEESLNRFNAIFTTPPPLPPFPTQKSKLTKESILRSTPQKD